MWNFLRKLTPFFLVLMTLAFIEAGLTATYSEARSMKGGRSFRTAPKSTSTKSVNQQNTTTTKKSGFSRGLMGGLLGGALGGMLFGSMFGMGGSGMGILPILILAGVAYFMFRKFNQKSAQAPRPGYSPNQSGPSPGGGSFGGGFGQSNGPPPAPSFGGMSQLDEGIAQIKETDPDFDSSYFTEIASDVFFQVQAGWMRRDVDSYKHLLGDQLASEYVAQFDEMKREGRINKLESIAVRTIDVVEAGSDGREDFVTVRFVASLLDYTVDDKSGEILEGSNSQPVKFEEDWTWARPVGTDNWKLEGIK